MTILQLNPTLPVITPKGKGQAWFIIDYSPEHDLHFVCAIDGSGELWTFPNSEIRAQKNVTLGRVPRGNLNAVS